MKASEGALSHDTILRLSWRQFGLYLDAFTWLLREETDDGRDENRQDDLTALKGDPGMKAAKKRLVEETKRDVAKHKRFAESNPAGGESRDLLADSDML